MLVRQIVTKHILFLRLVYFPLFEDVEAMRIKSSLLK